MAINTAAIRARADMLGNLISFFQEHTPLKNFYFKKVNGQPCYCVVGAILKLAGLSDKQIETLNVVGYEGPDDTAKDVETVLNSPARDVQEAAEKLALHGFDAESLLLLQQNNDFADTERFLEVLQEKRKEALKELDEAIDKRALTFLMFKFWKAEAGEQEIMEDLMINHNLPLESARVWLEDIKAADVDEFRQEHAELWAEIEEAPDA